MKDQHPVEALAADRADEALGERIGPWSPDRRADDLNPVGAENVIRWAQAVSSYSIFAVASHQEAASVATQGPPIAATSARATGAADGCCNDGRTR